MIFKIPHKSIIADRKSQVKQHMKTESHQTKLNSQNSTGQIQLFLSECDALQSTKSFYLDLISNFLSADISLCKIGNPELKDFLIKYTSQRIQMSLYNEILIFMAML